MNKPPTYYTVNGRAEEEKPILIVLPRSIRVFNEKLIPLLPTYNPAQRMDGRRRRRRRPFVLTMPIPIALLRFMWGTRT